MTLDLAINLLALFMAAVILVRAVCVLHGMDFKTRSRNYVMWLLFGCSYIALAVAGLGSALQIFEDRGNVGDWLWLFASFGLIVFDRRARANFQRNALRKI